MAVGTHALCATRYPQVEACCLQCPSVMQRARNLVEPLKVLARLVVVALLVVQQTQAATGMCRPPFVLAPACSGGNTAVAMSLQK